MGKFSRDKGARNERGQAKAWREDGWDAERQIQQRRVQDCADIHVRIGDAILMIECKDWKTITWKEVQDAHTQCVGYMGAANDGVYECPSACIHVPGTSLQLMVLDRADLSRLLRCAYAAGVSAGGDHGERDAA